MKGEKQWSEGRSAMEIAKYITKSLPRVPKEVEDALSKILPADSVFDWDGEYVTPLPFKGEGRNHDAILFNKDTVVTIEAKADETLGNLIGEEIKNASVNKLNRIATLLDYLFKGGYREYADLRYQLVTASAGTLIEAQKRRVRSAVMLVLVFNTNKTEEKKRYANHKDIEAFLNATNAYCENGLTVIPNNTDIKLYFKEIICE